MSGLVLFQTEPAEFKIAFALHMVTAAILFDGLLAGWTWLCVLGNPLCVLGFANVVLLLPVLILYACDVCMPFDFAVCAVCERAFWTARHRVVGLANHGTAAVGSRTEAHIGHFRKCFVETELLVLCK